MKKLLSIAFLIAFTTQAYTHKPILNDNSTYPADAPYEIEKPEISKAIYSTLTGEPHYYRIQSEVDFDFYAGILAAKIGECSLNSKFSFEVLDSEFHKIYLADGENFEWTPWGQNFASNEVFKAGTYYIKVFNNSNTGQYILAVGDIEKFSFTDIIGLIFSLGDIEDEFWDASKCSST